MKSRDFVIWIDGFIQGKVNLSVDDWDDAINVIFETEVMLDE